MTWGCISGTNTPWRCTKWSWKYIQSAVWISWFVPQWFHQCNALPSRPYRCMSPRLCMLIISEELFGKIWDFCHDIKEPRMAPTRICIHASPQVGASQSLIRPSARSNSSWSQQIETTHSSFERLYSKYQGPFHGKGHWPKPNALLSSWLVWHRHVLLVGTVYHDLYVSLKQNVPSLEMLHRRGHMPICLQFHHNRERNNKFNHNLET